MRELSGPLKVNGVSAAGDVSALVVPGIVVHIMVDLIGHPTITIPISHFSHNAETYF